MNSQLIRDMAINSANTYFNFLDKNNKGYVTIKVHQVIEKDNGVFELAISGKLFDPESIRYHIHGIEYTTTQVPQLLYDIDKLRIIIKPLLEFNYLFVNLSPKNIFIVSDLKFLVKRVEDWYNLYGDRLSLPKAPSKIQVKLSNSLLSEEQQNAVDVALRAPFSYVWGAPGTGKTRFVLSQCILHYIEAKKRIAVFAPTNNAIEQVLYGILEIFEENNIAPKEVLRLGTPSTKFALQYPDVCENFGIQKKIEELEKQIKNLENAGKYLKTKTHFESLVNDIIPEMLELNQLGDTNKEVDIEKELLLTEISFKKRLLIDTQMKLEDQMQLYIDYNHSLNSTAIRIKSFFNKYVKYRLEMQKEEVVVTVKKLNSEIDFLRERINGLNSEHTSLEAKQRTIQNELISRIESIKKRAKILGKASDILIKLNISNIKNISKQVEEKKDEAEEYLIKKKAELDGFLIDSQETIDKRIFDLHVDIKRLSSGSTQKRIKEVSVIACTVDCYLSRFTFDEKAEQKLPLEINHIFLDEAAYCNLIKGITLFAKGCPVTFLGDHMQLPPVCEMNDIDIKKGTNRNVFLWAQSTIFAEELFRKDRDSLYKMYEMRQEPNFDKINKCNLTASYRFGKMLARILDDYVYKNGFTSAKDDQFRIEVIDVAAEFGEKRRENPAEAKAIKEYINTQKKENSVILSPYKNQVSLIGKYLPKLRRDQRIMTVHKSQGQEWDTVILSVSDSSNIYFTNSLNQESRGLMLMNTAISRAKKKIIIVCDCNYWLNRKGQLISGLLNINLQ